MIKLYSEKLNHGEEDFTGCMLKILDRQIDRISEQISQGFKDQSGKSIQRELEFTQKAYEIMQTINSAFMIA